MRWHRYVCDHHGMGIMPAAKTPRSVAEGTRGARPGGRSGTCPRGIRRAEAEVHRVYRQRNVSAAPPRPLDGAPCPHRGCDSRRLRHPQKLACVHQHLGGAPAPIGLQEPIGVRPGPIHRQRHRRERHKLRAASVRNRAPDLPRLDHGVDHGAAWVGTPPP